MDKIFFFRTYGLWMFCLMRIFKDRNRNVELVEKVVSATSVFFDKRLKNPSSAENATRVHLFLMPLSDELRRRSRRRSFEWLPL